MNQQEASVDNPAPVRQARVGFLTYDLQEFTADCVSRINSSTHCVVTAYPIYRRVAGQIVDFDYLPSRRRVDRLRFSPKRATPESLPFGVNFRAAWRCARDNDAIVLFGLHAGTALLTALLGRLFGKAVISVNRTLPVEQERKRSCLVRFLKGRLLRLCQLHVAHTPNATATLPEVYGIPRSSIVEVPFEAGLSLFETKLSRQNRNESREALRKRFGWKEDETVFLFAGTLHGFKGTRDFLNSGAILFRRGHKVRLVLCGAEPQNATKSVIEEHQQTCCQLGIADRVWFTGRQSLEELTKFYTAADAFVLPTHRDTWPKVLAEASCFRLPLITTTTCGSAYHIVKHNETGLLVSPANPRELADAMLALLDESTRTRLGINGQAAWKAYCDPLQETNGFLAVIESALSVRNGHSESVCKPAA